MSLLSLPLLFPSSCLHIPRQSRTEAVVQHQNETTLSQPNIPTYYEGESDDISNETYCYSNIGDNDSDASHSSCSHYSTENHTRYQQQQYHQQ